MQLHPTGNARRSPGNPSQEEGQLCSRQPRRRGRMAWQGGHHQPQPCPQGGQGSCLTLPRNPSQDGGLQCPLPTCSALRQPWAAAANGSGHLLPAPVASSLCLRTKLLEAPARLAPARDYVRQHLQAIPHCARFLPTCTGAANLCPGTGGCGKSNAINTCSCHYPIPRLSLALRSLSQATHLLLDQLRTICFWQQLRKY